MWKKVPKWKAYNSPPFIYNFCNDDFIKEDLAIFVVVLSNIAFLKDLLTLLTQVNFKV